MGRWKTVIGPKLKARNFPNQQTKVRLGINILNKMNELGRATFEPVASSNLGVRARFGHCTIHATRLWCLASGK